MFSIGNIKLQSPYILAPMAGLTDLPFRKLCRKFGAAMAVSEMIASNPRVWNSQKSKQRLAAIKDEPFPRCVQICGNNPGEISVAAKLCESLGADIIDINLGCSVNKVSKKNCGAILMQDEKLCSDIFSAIASAVDIPVTVKMRLGWNHNNALEIAKLAEGHGLCAVTLHGRFGMDLFAKNPEFKTAKILKEHLSIPLIINGDIESIEQADKLLAYTKADSAMIGRAALGQPWVFSKDNNINHKEIIIEHLISIHAFYGEYMAVRLARKHMEWYGKRLPWIDNILVEFKKLESMKMQLELIDKSAPVVNPFKSIN